MGMAASQVNFLGLTGRKADILRQQQKLSNEKMALTRDMQKVSREYQRGLNEKVLKWSNNSGASYEVLSYNNLMRPSNMNLNKAYLLTDMNDKIVIDSKYKKYAEMISPNGKAGGDWESNRVAILSELTGYDASTVESYVNSKDEYLSTKKVLQDISANCPGKKDISLKKFLNIMPTVGWANDGSVWYINNNYDSNAYGHSKPNQMDESYFSEELDIGGKGTVFFRTHSSMYDFYEEIVNNLEKQNWFTPEQIAAFRQAGKDFTDDRLRNDDGWGWNTQPEQSDDVGNVGRTFNTVNLIDGLLDHYRYICKRDGIDSGMYDDGTDDKTFYVRDKSYDNWQAEYEPARVAHENAINNYNQFTEDVRRKIDFYEEIFSAIAEKGWSYNDNIDDTDYLNQMLQNNLYTITTIDRNIEYDDLEEKSFYKNEYVTRIADNFEKIFTVNDSDAREEALAEYEYKKNLINQKETRIDLRMQDLSTELSAINQMMQGIETVKKDNIERTFGIFG